MNGQKRTLASLQNTESILFLGIGGIGMSALARYFMSLGIQVYGYDKTESTLTKELIHDGARVYYEDTLHWMDRDFDLVIYTPAIPSDSILLSHFMSSDIPCMKRSEVLGLITKDKKTIAVAGAHGKTTVSTMVAYLLKSCGIDVSAFLGGISVNYNSNYLVGKSEYVVVEADEFDRSFLRLSPDIIVLTSIDTDHLDIYGDRKSIVGTFQEFLDLLSLDGWLIQSDQVIDDVKTVGKQIIYGLGHGDIIATDIQVFSSYSTFTVNHGKVVYHLNYNGRHNIENALAAIAVGRHLGLTDENMATAMHKFRGIKRRFEVILQNERYTYIDDYAHHPTEIKALLSSVREIYQGKKILAIFQPHLYSRTKDLASDFASALDMADETILLPIYPARELPIEGVSSELISTKMHSSVHIVDKESLVDALKQRTCTIILSIGAGDISTLVTKICQSLDE